MMIFFFPNPFQFVNLAVIWRFLVRSTESVTKYTNKWSFVFIISYICCKNLRSCPCAFSKCFESVGCGYTYEYSIIFTASCQWLFYRATHVRSLPSQIICLTSVLLLCSRQRTVLRDGRPSTRHHTPGRSKGYFFLRNGLLFSWYWRSFLKGKVAGAWSWPVLNIVPSLRKKYACSSRPFICFHCFHKGRITLFHHLSAPSY